MSLNLKEINSMGCVYQARNKINGMSYIGRTVQSLSKRKRSHERSAERRSRIYFHHALKRYGIEKFEWIKLFEHDDNNVLNEKEKELIDKMNTKSPYGYNLTDGGEGVMGFKKSEEECKRISASKKGIKQGPLSEEHKRKISLSLIGNKRRHGKKSSEETKKKISKSLKGNKYALGNKHTLSKETREKISQSLMGNKNSCGKKSKETRKKMSIVAIKREQRKKAIKIYKKIEK